MQRRDPLSIINTHVGYLSGISRLYHDERNEMWFTYESHLQIYFTECHLLPHC